MSFPLLTDEQMPPLPRSFFSRTLTVRGASYIRQLFTERQMLEHARAVESATRAPLLAEIERLTAELAAARKALALVQQHHATAWNRGHTMGMAANRDIARQAQAAVARDAWGNTQLTEALLAAEAERDEARAELAAAREDAERWKYVRDNTDISLDSHVWVTTTLGRRVHITSPCRGTEAERAIDAARGEKAQADTQRGA